MKKIYLYRTLEFVGFFLMVLFFLELTSKIFIPKWLTIHDNYERYITDGFYLEKKNSLDMIFIGNSDTYHSIYPMELWDSYGIASYNYSQPGTRISLDYYNLKNILLSQNPKYVMLSVDNVFVVKKPSNGNITKSITSMKFSRNKIQAILDNNVQNSIKLKASYLFPIIRFHSRYSDLTKEDFEFLFRKAYMPTKGTIISTEVLPLKNKNYMNKKKKVEEIPKKSIKYLDKIVSLCKKNNIELILIETPSADSWNYKRSDSILEYAKTNNLKFLDMNLYIDEIGINWETDTKDNGDHLNILGGLKSTKYIGEYMNSNFKIVNHKNDKQYKKWKEEYNEYLKLKKEAQNEIQQKINK